MFCFWFLFLFFAREPLGKPGRWHGTFELGENWRKLASLFGNVDVGANVRPVGRDVYHSNELVHASLTAYVPSDGVEK